jgi:hypothetical protein
VPSSIGSPHHHQVSLDRFVTGLKISKLVLAHGQSWETSSPSP